ncbi:unnamed protein product [Symbiodinium microadriaticum]|nr:unnamed protein product [Symbiodinium microadriaticum]CAE7304453.1 unnamed protein product [Symbiodinium sp. KB8]
MAVITKMTPTLQWKHSWKHLTIQNTESAEYIAWLTYDHLEGSVKRRGCDLSRSVGPGNSTRQDFYGFCKFLWQRRESRRKLDPDFFASFTDAESTFDEDGQPRFEEVSGKSIGWTEAGLADLRPRNRGCELASQGARLAAQGLWEVKGGKGCALQTLRLTHTHDSFMLGARAGILGPGNW